MTPQSLEANHPLEKVFGSIHRPGCLSSVSQGTSQDQWLLHAWVTERKPNLWVISRFTFTPRFLLSSRCHAVKCLWSGKPDNKPYCSERLKQMINLSAQSEDSGWNSNLSHPYFHPEQEGAYSSHLVSTARAQRWAGLALFFLNLASIISREKESGDKVWNWTMSLPRGDYLTLHWPGTLMEFIKTDGQ